jgi:hypothetical protein
VKKNATGKSLSGKGKSLSVSLKVKNEKKIFSYQYMTMHTPIESPYRDDKSHAVFKIIYGVIRP